MSRFTEAEQRYRELEEALVRGELSEEAFLLQVSQLRVVGDDGRGWMLDSRSGQWLVHDGRRWVFADPALESAGESGSEAEEPLRSFADPGMAERAFPPSRRASAIPRWLIAGVGALLVVGCLVGAVAAGWVLFLRGMGAGTPPPTSDTVAALVETWTPRPATATYTPTFTRTPTRMPTGVATPVRTNTPVPTAASMPTATPVPSSPTLLPSSTATSIPSPVPTATSTPVPQKTYVVQKGDTLYEIARRFGVSVQALVAANGIADPALIRPGQVLVIPQPGVTAPAVTRTATPAKGSSTPKPSATPTK